jgi:hypothetical protein
MPCEFGRLERGAVIAAEGIAAQTGDDEGNAEMGMAKSLAEWIGVADVPYTRNKVKSVGTTPKPVVLPEPEPEESMIKPDVTSLMKSTRATIKAWASQFGVANGVVRPVRDRIPVFLDRVDFGRWLHSAISRMHRIKYSANGRGRAVLSFP